MTKSSTTPRTNFAILPEASVRDTPGGTYSQVAEGIEEYQETKPEEEGRKVVTKPDDSPTPEDPLDTKCHQNAEDPPAPEGQKSPENPESKTQRSQSKRQENNVKRAHHRSQEKEVKRAVSASHRQGSREELLEEGQEEEELEAAQQAEEEPEGAEPEGHRVGCEEVPCQKALEKEGSKRHQTVSNKATQKISPTTRASLQQGSINGCTLWPRDPGTKKAQPSA